MRYAVLPLCALVVAGCGSEGAVVPDGGGGGGAAPTTGCLPGERLVGESCLPAGLNACAAGFVADEAGGCQPRLPELPCEDGTTAVPGDEACRPLAECGDGPWGLIETGPDTVYVDAGAVGGDGSAAAPLATLAEAVAVAPAGATVAVAAGDYEGGLALGGKPLTLWGRCPSLVSLSAGAPPLVRIQGSAEVTVRGMALTGAGTGVVVDDGQARLIDLWVHDLTNIGISVAGPATTVFLQDLHVARVVDVGVLVLGAEVEAQDVVVRDVSLTAGGMFGRAWDVEAASGQAGRLTLDGGVAERAWEYGVYVSGSIATLSRLVVRDVTYNTDTDPGRGVTARANDAGMRSTLELRDAVIERTVDAGVLVAGGDGLLERVVVRDVAPRPDGLLGYGVSAVPSGTGGAPSLVFREGLVERCHTVGLLGSGGVHVAEGVWVRDTLPEVASGWFGRGIAVHGKVPLAAPEVTVIGTRIDRVSDAGIAVFDGVATIDGVAIDGVAAAQDGTFGDGIDAFGGGNVPAQMIITRSSIFRATRAGVANFASTTSIEASRVGCNGIDLNGESSDTVTFAFDDLGHNLCGCEVAEPCKVLTSGLTPPSLPGAPSP